MPSRIAGGKYKWMENGISIAGVSERDIDLLLLEEFLSSPDFSDWFVKQALGDSVNLGRCMEARRSVSDGSGESDLEISLEQEDGVRTRLLIENKVNAGLQPTQAERYHKRGKSSKARNLCSSYHTVIVAPARYFGESESTKGFGSRVTYETILDWFSNALNLGERRHYKLTLLRSAIEKGTLGYQPVEDAPVTAFWHAYWQVACEYAPRLEMREPDSKPSGASFIYFRPAELGRAFEICHKFTKGRVDLHLKGMGTRMNEVKDVLGSFLEEGMSLKQAAQSAAIRLQVPVLEPTLSVEEQLSDIKLALDAAGRLLDWILAHRNVWIAHVEKA